jgi:hypothetical protein
MLVAHACNPSYSGGRDQEDHDSKPAWAKSSQDPILKKPITKRGWWRAQGVDPDFKPHYHKKTQNQNQKNNHHHKTISTIIFYPLNFQSSLSLAKS